MSLDQEYTELRDLALKQQSSDSSHDVKGRAEIERIQQRTMQLRRARASAWQEDLPAEYNNTNSSKYQQQQQVPSSHQQVQPIQQQQQSNQHQWREDSDMFTTVTDEYPVNYNESSYPPAIMRTVSTDSRSHDGASARVRRRQPSVTITNNGSDSFSNSTTSEHARRLQKKLLKSMHSPRQQPPQPKKSKHRVKIVAPPPRGDRFGASREYSGESRSLTTTDSLDRKLNAIDSHYRRGSDLENVQEYYTDDSRNLNTSDPTTDCTSDDHGGENESDPALQNIMEKDSLFGDIVDPENSTETNSDKDLSLHDLCGEANGVDDIAWRNALFLLATTPELATISDQGWTPLHICCMGSPPPPLYMIQALVYAYPKACKLPDLGGRLPLHLVAGSSGNVQIMNLLVESCPESLYATDEIGYSPLHLLIKNVNVELSISRVEVLLGDTLQLQQSVNINDRRQSREFFLQRRGEHLDLTVDDLQRIHRKKPVVTVLHKIPALTGELHKYPADVQSSFRQLTSWKRKQERNNNNNDGFDEPILSDNVDEQNVFTETNPAAIAIPHTLQLPIHLVISRAVTKHAMNNANESISLLSTESATEEKKNDDDELDHNIDIERPRVASRSESKADIKHLAEVLRLLVSSYPQSLSLRDDTGMTPLLVYLTSIEQIPSLDIVEILIGMRSPGYHGLPGWARDMPLSLMTHPPFVNAAMVPILETGQLPLHIVAEEQLSFLALVETLYKVYPGAIRVQDRHGRTPLHTALSNYRGLPIDPSVIAMLMSDRIVHIQDDYGAVPFDLLVKSARRFPNSKPSELSDEELAVYHEFFKLSIINVLQNKERKDDFFQTLNIVPSWIRAKACLIDQVQDLMIKRMGSPVNFLIIIADGILLAFLLTIFRLHVKLYIDGLRSGDMTKSWYSYCIYAVACTRLICRVVLAMLSAVAKVFTKVTLYNIWGYIDVSAMLMCIGTSVLMYGDLEEKTLLALGTATTGMIWLTLLGYMATWVRGVAMFTGTIKAIIQRIFWPIAAFSLAFVAFAQMFYTLLQARCIEMNSPLTDCAVHDAYRIVYIIWRGEQVDNNSNTAEYLAQEKILLLALLVTFYLLCLGLFVFIVAVASTWPANILDSFWEMKLAYILALNELKLDNLLGNSSTNIVKKHSHKMRTQWSLLYARATMRPIHRDSKFWYKKGNTNVCYAIFAAMIMSIWFVLGLITCGLLWPPQLREFVFRHWKTTNSRNKSSRDHNNILEMRNEVAQLKAMSYERYGDIERQVRNVKDLFLFALNDEV